MNTIATACLILAGVGLLFLASKEKGKSACVGIQEFQSDTPPALNFHRKADKLTG